MLNFLKKMFGDNEDKVRRKYQPQVDAINALEATYQQFSDDELRARTGLFRKRLAAGETLDDLLPEAFAAVREASRRTIGMRHYDVQLIGGIVLHEGRIAEMKTGEGKTLVATLALYLNALDAKGSYLVTVNDYLARRDAGWMGPIYHLLDLSVGFIAHNYSALFDPEYVDPNAPLDDERLVHWRPCNRQEAYAADITYGTNNEFGFDYLRDNMVNSLQRVVQRGQHYAIVDEVDNILIDEARTPLIISGPASRSSDQYARFAQVVKPLRAGRVTPDEVKKGAEPDGDVLIDPRSRTVVITEEGLEKVERQLEELGEGESVYDPQHSALTHYLENALKARFVFQRDKDYVVQNGEVIIVDEFTGRLMPGRRWSDGLHQSVEAKEEVRVQNETVTYATITFQNYFRMYTKLAGMTGTAATEKEEFAKIYNREVTMIPTNRPVIRVDNSDLIYRTEDAKFRALINEIRERSTNGQPILVGTTSVDTSERLSALLKREKIKHQVLNAKQNADEARIIAQAGQLGAVTIATNMAGRGTDILLGGNPEALAGRYLEEQGVTRAEIGELAQQLFDEQKSSKMATQQSQFDARLISALHQLHDEYEQALRRIDDPREGLNFFLMRSVLGDLPDQYNQNIALVDAVLYQRLNEAHAIVQATDWLREEHIAEIWRRYSELNTYRSASPQDRAEFLADKVFRQVYTARSLLVQRTLRGELEPAQALISSEPGLKPEYIDDILRIKRECEEQREQIKAAGGLHIIGTERHEARRIDNQLRGRAGRQGDPGSSTFYLSLEDELMRRFGRMDTIQKTMERLGVEEDMPIGAGIINKSIESAQTRVEGFNFDMRKHTVEYDDVMNKQRAVIYNKRRRVLEESDEQRRIAELFQRYRDQEQLLAEGQAAIRALATDDHEEAQEQLQTLFADVTMDLAALQAADDATLPSLLAPLAREQQQHSIQRLMIDLEAFVVLPEDTEQQLQHYSHSEAEQFINRLWRDQTADDLEQYIKNLFAVEFATLIERYLETYDTWMRQQIQEAINDALNPATDEVNVRLVQRRLSSILPEASELDPVELGELADHQLQRRLEGLISLNIERGHNIELLAHKIMALVPSLLPGPQDVIWANVSPAIREQLREDYLERYRAALKLMTTTMPPAEAEQLQYEMINAIRQLLQPLFVAATRLTAIDLKQIFDAIAVRNREVLLTVLRQPDVDAIEEMLNVQVAQALDYWREAIGVQSLAHYQHSLMLQTIDLEWQQYLTAMEDMRQGIGLQAIGQRDPLVQYQTEGYRMFRELLDNIDQNIVRYFFRQLPTYYKQIADHQAEQVRRDQAARAGYELAQAARTKAAGGSNGPAKGQTLRRKLPKVGRNDLCPCGSGKKYKYCHGRNESDADAAELVGVATAQANVPVTAPVAAAPAGGKGRGVPASPPQQKPPRGRGTASAPQRGKKAARK